MRGNVLIALITFIAIFTISNAKILKSKNSQFDLFKQTVTIVLEPNVAYSAQNPFMWGVTGKCKVITQDTAVISGKVFNGQVKINDVDVGTGIDKTVKNGEVYKMFADKWTKVEAVNKSANKIVLECSAA